MGLNERVKAIEAKAGTQAGPIVIVYENDSIPQGTPPDAVIIYVKYDGNAKGSQPDGRGDSPRNSGRQYEH